jgi:hypothetical protein
VYTTAIHRSLVQIRLEGELFALSSCQINKLEKETRKKRKRKREGNKKEKVKKRRKI